MKTSPQNGLNPSLKRRIKKISASGTWREGLLELLCVQQRFNGATISCYLVEPIGAFNGHI